MLRSSLASAIGLLREAVAEVRDNGSNLSIADVVDTLAATGELSQLVSQVQVGVVAAGQRTGLFVAGGYGKKPESAVAIVLGVDRSVAQEIVRGAQYTGPDISADGEAVLPAMAVAFAEGRASLRHLSGIGRLLDTVEAQALPVEVWAGIERRIAAVTDEYTPSRLARYGRDLIAEHQMNAPVPADGSDERAPVQINELHMTSTPGGGLEIFAHFDDPVRAASIRAVIEAKSAPASATDLRSTRQRQGDALADCMGFILTHGDTVLPDAGGHRPQVAVHIQQTDLEHRARGGTLEFGATLHPTALRQLCCDAGVIPIVFDGAGQPLDIGRTGRTIPDYIRRVVTARDGGCAHPGCDRPPTWSEVHHIREWTKGGHTRLDNLVLLCTIHHREIHSTKWQVRIASDGLPEFIAPNWLDPSMRPRRHPRILPRTTPTGAPPWSYPPRATSKTRRQRVKNAHP